MDKSTIKRRVAATSPGASKGIELIPKDAMVKVRKEAAGASQLSKDVANLTVDTPDAYIVADEILGKIRHARKLIENRLDSILDPINAARKNLLAFKHELDDPLAAVEGQVRDKMRVFKLEEAAEIRRQQVERDQEAQRLREEAEEKQRRAELAHTAPMRDKLETQAAELEQEASEVEQVEPEAVKVVGSGSRTVQKWKVTDLAAVIRAVAAGDLPEDILMINTVRVNQFYFKDDPKGVAQWPGFEVYEDVVIVGR